MHSKNERETAASVWETLCGSWKSNSVTHPSKSVQAYAPIS